MALLASIVLHELGHALMARRYGIGTEDITLYLIGGVARLRRMPRSAGPELLIALAGPAVTSRSSRCWPSRSASGSRSACRPGSWQAVLFLNAGLAVFNMLPVFPMDGGRVLRALLSGWLGRARATEAAATVGQFAAVLGGVAALASGQWTPGPAGGPSSSSPPGMERAQVRAEGRAEGSIGGFLNVPAAPVGFRWSDRGDGVWRLVPIMATASAPGRGRSWT